jgi:hypothetical protein
MNKQSYAHGSMWCSDKPAVGMCMQHNAVNSKSDGYVG